MRQCSLDKALLSENTEVHDEKRLLNLQNIIIIIIIISVATAITDSCGSLIAAACVDTQNER